MVEATKSDSLKAFSDYLSAVERTISGGYASEGSHYPTLKTLLESLGVRIIATSLPSRIECGAPDFILTRGSATIGYVEAKDIGRSLDEAERTEQLKRYLPSLSNLILTDYLEFRWYVNGERRLIAHLGTLTLENKVKRHRAGVQAVAELLSNFLSHKADAVGTPKELAVRMARQAHLVRNLIINAFDKEPEGGSLHSQLAAFRDNLIPDLSVDYFADMHAQTIAYGLFAARCTNSSGKEFTRKDAAYLLPRTNPFLRRLFNQIAGPDLDDRIAWLVDDLAQLLAQADMEAILKDFGKRTAREDPVVHFYETFLKEYDPKIREMRGVYYTPEPVVSYIVRSIDHLLKTRFDKLLGLADDKTLILDPAVGTATFLYMVINEIHQAIISQGQKGVWNDYAAEKLLPRIFGFEMLMAPYAVAHLKLGVLLQETGYQFKSDQRLGIYLTNTLEEAVKRADTLFARWITEEANAAARIKRDEPIMVVLGNPPYSISSANKGEYIEKLMESYKATVRSERNIQPLSDDYIKFIRFAHERIERTGHGIIGMITNSSYLSGLIHRGMREELLKSFSEIFILDLHGSSMSDDIPPDESKDENVFDIRQGVAISLFVKKLNQEKHAQVRYADVWGLREQKYQYLMDNDINMTDWQILEPKPPHFFLIPKKLDSQDEYEKGWSVTSIFPVNSTGIKTHRDHFVVDFEEKPLQKRIALFSDKTISDDEIAGKFSLRNTRDWNLPEARMKLKEQENWRGEFQSYLYRPFDIRSICYSTQLIELPRHDVMRNMLAGHNLGMVVNRQVLSGHLRFTLATRLLTDCHILETAHASAYIFPLYIYTTEGEMQFEGGNRQPNLNHEFIQDAEEKLGLRFIEDDRGDLEQTFGPEDIFDYAYAVFHSPTYRTRYAELLKMDFPRLPLTSNKGLFKSLAAKGAELVSLHFMESPVLNNFITRYPIADSNTVEKVNYDENNQRVYINKTQYFGGVPPEVWEFHIGGYQVCQKWLKDRKGRPLTYDELTHYQKVIVALKETIRLMTEIDELIPSWPVG